MTPRSTRRYHTDARERVRLMKRDAAKRGIKWQMDDHVAAAMLTQPCFWCGRWPEPRKFHGLDRRDNQPFYSAANVVSCCWQCNRMKSSLRESEWALHVAMVAQEIENSRVPDFETSLRYSRYLDGITY